LELIELSSHIKVCGVLDYTTGQCGTNTVTSLSSAAGGGAGVDRGRSAFAR